jgi:hypothetical protein
VFIYPFVSVRLSGDIDNLVRDLVRDLLRDLLSLKGDLCRSYISYIRETFKPPDGSVPTIIKTQGCKLFENSWHRVARNVFKYCSGVKTALILIGDIIIESTH